MTRKKFKNFAEGEDYAQWKMKRISKNPGERYVPTDARDLQRYRQERGR